MGNKFNTVHLAGNGRFVINDSIVVYDLETTDEGVSYICDYDETNLTEEEVTEIVSDFLEKTITGIVNDFGGDKNTLLPKEGEPKPEQFNGKL